MDEVGKEKVADLGRPECCQSWYRGALGLKAFCCCKGHALSSSGIAPHHLQHPLQQLYLQWDTAAVQPPHPQHATAGMHHPAKALLVSCSSPLTASCGVDLQ